VVGVAVVEVELAGALVGGFQVGGAGVAVEGVVVGAQQRGAGALALPVGVDDEDGRWSWEMPVGWCWSSTASKARNR
jgi:hypothetical protein